MERPSEFGEWLYEEGSSAAFFDDYCNWRRIPELEAYVRRSGAAELARALLRSAAVTFYHEHVLVKQPGCAKLTPWHQDLPYYPLNGNQMLSLWMPLDPVPEAAALRFAAGSHRGPAYHPRKFATGLPYSTEHEGEEGDHKAAEQWQLLTEEALAALERGPALSWATRPGDCVVFHGLTLHSAPGVAAGAGRRALSTRWCGDDITLGTRPWAPSPPITGGLQA